MAVRSKRLAAVSQAAGASGVVYTVPSGETTLIKSVSIASAGAGSTGVGVYIRVGGAGTYYPIAVEIVATGTAKFINLWAVLQPTDTISVFTATTASTVYLSGSELEGVAD